MRVGFIVVPLLAALATAAVCVPVLPVRVAALALAAWVVVVLARLGTERD